jgi:hypothetical protein
MKPPLPRILSDVPRTLHAQLEVAKAIRTLLGPDERELARQRDNEIAAIRRDLDAFARDLPKAFAEAAALAKAELPGMLRKYSPDQPRVPAGNPKGGEWTRDDDNSGAGDGRSTWDAAVEPAQINDADRHSSDPSTSTYNDTRILSDATPVNAWIPGARYAGGVEGEGENRAVGLWAEATPAQEARLAIAEARWESIRAAGQDHRSVLETDARRL